MGERQETNNDGRGSRKRALAWWPFNHRCSVKHSASVACVCSNLADAAAQRRHFVVNAERRLARLAYIKLIASNAAGLPGRERRRSFVRRPATMRGKQTTRIRNHASNAESSSSAATQTHIMAGLTALRSAGEKRGGKMTRANAWSVMLGSGGAGIQKTKTCAVRSSAWESAEP